LHCIVSRNLTMTPMDFNSQYSLVTSSRQVLLEYCERISDNDFVTENSSFGRGSIRNLLVHVGNTYEFWIGRHALKLGRDFTAYNTVQNALQAKGFYLTIDSLISRFIDLYSGKQTGDLEFEINDRRILASPLKLFTHVITHEFHHKGQILSLSRHLGYIPVDTDIIR
jgi:uncharacterized damage-inducible protein DinB